MNFILLSVVVTVYAGPYVGQPLYCDCDGSLIYSVDTTPWLALDEGLYGEFASCGDEIVVWAGGEMMTLLALDAGPLFDYYVEDWPELPIVADIPMHLSKFEGLSSRATVVNKTRAKRRLEGMAGR